MSGDSKMQDATSIMCQHQEHVQDLKADRRYDKEINRHKVLNVIFEEGSPRLRRRLAGPNHVLGDGWLGNLDAQPSPSWFLATRRQEIDYYSKLSAAPEAEQCGWLKDKYGLSWQVIPSDTEEMMQKGTPGQISLVTQAFLEMKKFDLAAQGKPTKEHRGRTSYWLAGQFHFVFSCCLCRGIARV